LIAVTGRVPRGSAAWARIGAVAGLAAVFQAAYFSAVAVSSVAVATLITIGSAPILVVVLDGVTARRLPGWAVARPVLVGLTGLGLLVGSPTGQPAATALAGAGRGVLSGAGFALLTLLGRRPAPGLDDATSTGYGFGIGGLVLAAVTVGTSGTLQVPLSEAVLALLGLLATVPTAVAYTLYFRGLRGSTATTGTVVALLELTGTLLAIALLGEQLSTAGVVGAVLLLASVLDSGRTHARRPGSAVPP
jgi:DME family drug/metabolite transporter